MARRLLFLCQHGILRSAYAAAVAKAYAEKHNQNWVVEFGGLYDEKGIGPGWVGTALTKIVRKSPFYPLITISQNQLLKADIIYVMTQEMQLCLEQRYPSLKEKVRCLYLPEDLVTTFILTRTSKKRIIRNLLPSLHSLEQIIGSSSLSSP